MHGPNAPSSRRRPLASLSSPSQALHLAPHDSQMTMATVKRASIVVTTVVSSILASRGTSSYITMPCIAGPSRWANHQAQPLAVPLLPRRHYASRKAASGDLDDDRDEQHIRSEWASALVARRSSLRVSKSSRESLPKSVFDVTFSRSSGAGGQHVNKVSTKATVRLCLAAATADGRMYEEEKSPFPLPIPREVARRAAKESVSSRSAPLHQVRRC